MGLTIFEDDDQGYATWLASHAADGYVLNTTRPPRGGYLKLHRATCEHISKLRPGYTTFTAGEYLKICADGPHARTDLERWASSRGWEAETGCYCVTW